MSRNNTGNPIGSEAFPDFQDNVKNTDVATNSLDADYWDDRLGKRRLTWEGMTRLSNLGAAVVAAERSEAAADIAVNAISAVSYLTKADADAAQPVQEGQLAIVTNDPNESNNGYWVSNGSSWIWSVFQPADANHVNSLSDDVSEITKKLPDKTSGLLFAVTDADGRLTWLQVDKDGGPSELAINALRRKNEVTSGLLFAVTDAENRVTELILDKKGQVPAHIVKNWATRAGLDLDSQKNSGYYKHSSGSFVSGKANLSEIVGWGSSTIEIMRDELVINVATMLTGVSYVDQGYSGDRIEHIGGRMGAIPLNFKVDGGIIPAEMIAVDLSTSTRTTYFKPTEGTLGGISGKLTCTPAGGWKFTRTEAGDAVSVGDDNLFFIPEFGTQHRDSISIINAGKNNIGTNTSENIFENTLNLTNYLTPAFANFVVMGHFSNTNSSELLKERVDELNNLLSNEYGPLYFDLLGVLSSPEIWSELNITPNEEDLTCQSTGRLPPSLGRDAGHISAQANELVAYKLITFIKDLFL